jgi:hypothetical protein
MKRFEFNGEDISVGIHQWKIDDKHTDSYWFDGLVAETENFELRAVGDIEFECEEPKDDEDIAKMYENNQFYLNNWFEILEKNEDSELMVGSDISGDYDSAISKLIKTQYEFVKENNK